MTSSNAIALFSSQALTLLPEGGLAFLKEGDDFLFEDSQKQIINQFHFQSKQQAVLTLITLVALLPRHSWLGVLGAFVKRGDIGKEELFFLYRSQSPDVRTQSPYITIANIWEVASDGVISKDELVYLAEEVLSVHLSDLYCFFGGGGWYYRINSPFSVSFLSHWYKITGEFYNADYGKLASLIAIEFYAKAPQEVTFSAIEERVQKLASRDPSNHGISRYVSLLYRIAADEKTEASPEKALRQKKFSRRRVLVAITSIIINAVSSRSRSGHYSGQMLLDFFLDTEDMTDDEKEIMILDVQKVCNEIAGEYLTFTDRAWTRVQSRQSLL